MTVDVFEGARYHDPVFDSELTVVRVREDTDDGVMLELDYDAFDGTMSVSLDQFRDGGITLLESPEQYA